MRLLGTTALTALLAAGSAYAGGIERTNQSVGVLFEEGRYLEFRGSFGNPSVSGIGGPGNPTPGVATGNMTESFLNFGVAYKADLNDQLSYAIIYDQPYGANVLYPVSAPPYAFAASNAEFNSHALTGILQYNMDNNVSVFGGLRAQTIEANAEIAFAGYSVEADRSLELGYLAGVAYEKPEIALRVALTYLSAIEYDLEATEVLGASSTSTVPVEMPQAINLEFQSGVAEDTLVFGSVRWVDWSEFNISPPVYVGAPFSGGLPLVNFVDDRLTYTLGVGRRLNENWSILGSVSYEETTGSITGNLGPTDGFTSVGLGAVYTKDNMKVTGGVSYVDIGDANTTAAASFTGNNAFGAGIRVGFNF